MIYTGHWDTCLERTAEHLEKNRLDWISLRKVPGASDFIVEIYPEQIGEFRLIREGVWEALKPGLEDALDELGTGRNTPSGSTPIAMRARRSPSGRFFVGVVYAT